MYGAMNAGDIFNNVGTAYVGNAAAADQTNTADESSAVKKARWFEQPLTFIGVIVLMLIVARFVERKVG